MTKWIAMAGLHGCMPNVCEEFDNRESAVDFLCYLHELNNGDPEDLELAFELSQDGYTDLLLSFHGNEYAEVTQKEETE